jgi:DNA-binding MarR family transcriptional regulator
MVRRAKYLVQTVDVAQKIVDIMPQIISKISSDMRCAGVGMNPPHFRILALLARGSHNLSELADYQGVSLATMSKTIATLAERGWVTRLPDASDKRVVRIELSDLGRQLLVDMHTLLRQKVSEILAVLSQPDLSILSDGLEVLQKALSDAPENEMVHAFHEGIHDGREETGLAPEL